MTTLERDISICLKIAENIPDVHVELETSFSNKIKSSKQVLGGMHLNTFNRFKAHIHDNTSSGKYGKFTITENIEDEDKIYNIQGLSIGEQTGKVSKLVVNKDGIMIKVRNYYDLLNEYGMKTSLSLEQKITEYPDLPKKPDIIRHKKRTSYLINSLQIRVDFTVVNEEMFEIEVEYVDELLKINLDAHKTNLKKFYIDMNESAYPYTIDSALSVMRSMHRIMNADIPQTLSIDSKMLAQARNLKMRDLVYGGMVGGEYQGKPYRMSATLKADGIRRWIYITQGVMWLVMAPQEFSILGHVTASDLEGTILEVEYIPLNNRLKGAPTERWWLCGFDCLAYRGESIVDKSHFERMQQLSEVISKISVKNVKIEAKEFHYIDTVADFYRINKKLLNTSTLFKTDGIIYTPDQVPYKVDYGKKRANQRCLVNEPEILKFKRVEDLGIDFKIMRAEGKLELYCKNNMLFKGSELYPITRKILDNTNKYLDPTIPNGSLCEMFWNPDEERLESHRIRTDRTHANNIDIAIDVWNDAHLPILPGTLIGTNGQGFIRYHNRVKAEIFQRLATIGGKASSTSKKTLVDLGSGMGGDGRHWKEFSRIVAVEPNRDSILEMMKRLEGMGIADRVMIVNCGAEDTERIWSACSRWLGGAADCLTMMLSMSFLFIEKDGYKKLANTINTCLNPSGTMGFLTIDGNAVRQLMLPNHKKIKFSYITLKYIDDLDQLYINLHDPDTGKVHLDQHEGLVDIEALARELKYWKLCDYHSATKEKMLCREDAIITKLYFSGYFFSNLKNDPKMKVVLIVNDKLVTYDETYKAYNKYMREAHTNKEEKEISAKSSVTSRVLWRTSGRRSVGLTKKKTPEVMWPSLGKGKTQEFKYTRKDVEFLVTRHYTQGNGNCAFHGFLQCTDKTYSSLKSDEKEENAVALRKSLASWLMENPHELDDVPIIEDDNFYSSPGKMIEKIGEDGELLYAQSMKYLANMTGYNIIVVYQLAGQEPVSMVFRSRKIIIEEKNFLFIFGNGGHFEACSYKGEFLHREADLQDILRVSHE